MNLHHDTHPTIQAIPAFNDNYIWGLTRQGRAAVVDPGDAEPVLQWLNQSKLSLDLILVTHHHGDHTGGIQRLKQAFPSARSVGPASLLSKGVEHAVREGEIVHQPSLNLSLTAWLTPGHTLDHVCYWGSWDGMAQPILFAGDTLFIAGCGRLFEGSPEQMAVSLQRLASLPDDTFIYCAHEYTLANLKFALAAEPSNPSLKAMLAEIEHLRTEGLSTVPGTLAAERLTNPYLRALAPNIQAHFEIPGFENPPQTPLETFTALRAWKNRF